MMLSHNNLLLGFDSEKWKEFPVPMYGIDCHIGETIFTLESHSCSMAIIKAFVMLYAFRDLIKNFASIERGAMSVPAIIRLSGIVTVALSLRLLIFKAAPEGMFIQSRFSSVRTAFPCNVKSKLLLPASFASWLKWYNAIVFSSFVN